MHVSDIQTQQMNSNAFTFIINARITAAVIDDTSNRRSYTHRAHFTPCQLRTFLYGNTGNCAVRFNNWQSLEVMPTQQERPSLLIVYMCLWISVVTMVICPEIEWQLTDWFIVVVCTAALVAGGTGTKLSGLHFVVLWIYDNAGLINWTWCQN